VPTDEQIVDHLLTRQMPVHHLDRPTPDVPWPAGLAMRCPKCAAPLTKGGDGWQCACGARYPRRDGIVSFYGPVVSLKDRIDGMLAARGGPAYAEQKSDLLALATQLELPFRPPTSWDATAGLVHGWVAANLTPMSAGMNILRSENDDPQLISPWLGIDMRRGADVVVEMAVQSAQPSVPAELFWWIEGEPCFQQSHSTAMAIPGDGTMRTHRFRTPPGLSQDALLLRVRLDPCANPGSMIRLGKLSIEPSTRN
jgi:hypothetical protein